MSHKSNYNLVWVVSLLAGIVWQQHPHFLFLGVAAFPVTQGDVLSLGQSICSRPTAAQLRLVPNGVSTTRTSTSRRYRSWNHGRATINMPISASSSRRQSQRQQQQNDQQDTVSLLLEELRSNNNNKNSPNATRVTKWIEELTRKNDEQPNSDSSVSSAGTTNSLLTTAATAAATAFDPLLGLYDVSFVQPARAGDNPVGGRWTRTSKNKINIHQNTQNINTTTRIHDVASSHPKRRSMGWSWRNRRSFQHVLPANSTRWGRHIVPLSLNGSVVADGQVVAEVINVISLEAARGRLRVTVILRGDAIPVPAAERSDTTVFCQRLSDKAVRALFDAPRILFSYVGKRTHPRLLVNLNVGPQTSVVLDTLYVDDRVRIGLEGRSGSRFVFARCPSNDNAEANEYKALLEQRPWSKPKTVTSLIALAAGAGAYGAMASSPSSLFFPRRVFFRTTCAMVSVASALLGALVAFSGGGIEAGDRSSVADAQRFQSQRQ